VHVCCTGKTPSLMQFDGLVVAEKDGELCSFAHGPANLVQTREKVSRANLGRYHRFFVGQYASNSEQQVGPILRICAEIEAPVRNFICRRDIYYRRDLL
jgi:hypothetical protein